MSETGIVKGSGVERRVRKLARERKLPCQFIAGMGKGSHGRLYLGQEFTTLKDRKKEIGRDLLAKMCSDLKIDPRDL
jgi:mRNA interferase HicA